MSLLRQGIHVKLSLAEIRCSIGCEMKDIVAVNERVWSRVRILQRAHTYATYACMSSLEYTYMYKMCSFMKLSGIMTRINGA